MRRNTLKVMWRSLVGLLTFASFSVAQAPAPGLGVASIKRANPSDPVFGLRIQPGRFSISNATLEMLIGFAYSLPNSQLSGTPPWGQTDSFTIEAETDSAAPIAAGNAGVSQVMQMLQSLLAERFGLSVHKETRQLPVYELIVGKTGTRLKKSADGTPPSRRITRGRLSGSMPIPLLAASVSQWVDRPVFDRTGLAGNYDVELTYSPELGQGARFSPAAADPPSTNTDTPSLFSAVREQLGLELKSARGPVEMLVVDGARRPGSN